MRKLLNKGFTLIELLVVIAIVGILMAVVIIGINPIDKINQANDSKVMSDIGTVGGALEAYSTLNSGSFPAAVADLVTSSDLKVAPVAATGYTYTYSVLPAGCTTAAKTCTSACYSGSLKATKWTATPFWKYSTSTTTGGTALATATGC